MQILTDKDPLMMAIASEVMSMNRLLDEFQAEEVARYPVSVSIEAEADKDTIKVIATQQINHDFHIKVMINGKFLSLDNNSARVYIWKPKKK